MTNAYLKAFGMHVPERVVTNQEIGELAHCDPAWIEGVSGIRERRWADPESSVADLAVEAAKDCLDRASLSAASLGMLIVASGSGASGFPGPAAAVAAALGLETTPALDVPMASAGSLFGLALASKLVEFHGDVLVIGAEKMSAVIQASSLDPNTAILFGDGAGAALVSSRPAGWKIVDAVLHTDGQFRDVLTFDWKSGLRMDGKSVILQATRKLPSVIHELLERQSLTPAEIRAFLLHQANQNLSLRVAKALNVPEEKVYSNVARYGNTSSASMLIAAAEWSQTHPAPGPIVFSAFGAGFHWGALLARPA